MARSVLPWRYWLTLLGALFSTSLGIATYTTRRLNAPTKRERADYFSFTPWDIQVPHEDVRFPTEDGVTLAGWWLPQPDSDRVVVACTGYRGAKHDLLGIGSALWRVGNNVLLFDFRGCGESDAAPQSLAYNELPDARAAVAFAAERLPRGRLGLLGYSMGAALSILVAAEDPRVRAVVADSSFADIRGVIANAFRRKRLPSRPLLDLTDVVNRWRYGYSIGAVRPVESIGRIAPRPILIIHGAADMTTPVKHAYQLYEAAGQGKELWVLDGVEHCGAYFHDRRAYVDRVTNFFAGHLSEGSTVHALRADDLRPGAG